MSSPLPALLLLAACGGEPLLVPPTVDRVVVDHGLPITDPVRVAAIRTEIAAQDRDWRRPVGTFPSGGHTVELYVGPDLVTVVWIGPDWIGARRGGEDAGDNRLHPLSAEEEARLVGLLR